MVVPSSRRVSSVRSCPCICDRIVFAASVEVVRPVCAAPDEHFTATPNCRVAVATLGCVRGAGSQPTVSDRIVFPAGVLSLIATPDNHFIAGPDCSV